MALQTLLIEPFLLCAMSMQHSFIELSNMETKS